MSASLLIPLLFVGFAVAGPFSGGRMHAPVFDVCCNIEPFMAGADHHEMRECVKDILGDPKSIKPSSPPTEKEMEEMAEKITCVEECTAKKFELLDDDGNFVLDKTIEFSKDKTKGTFMENSIEEVVKECNQEIEKGISKESKCNPKPLLMHNCLLLKTLSSCPADQVKDKAKCDSIISDFKNGKMPPHLPSPPPPDN